MNDVKHETRIALIDVLIERWRIALSALYAKSSVEYYINDDNHVVMHVAVQGTSGYTVKCCRYIKPDLCIDYTNHKAHKREEIARTLFPRMWFLVMAPKMERLLIGADFNEVAEWLKGPAAYALPQPVQEAMERIHCNTDWLRKQLQRAPAPAIVS